MKKRLEKSPYEGQGVQQVSRDEIFRYDLETFLTILLSGNICKERTEDMRDWLEKRPTATRMNSDTFMNASTRNGSDLQVEKTKIRTLH